MARHIFELNGRVLQIHDSDVALLKHFLELGAERAGKSTVLEALRRWEWPGPGVWVNVEESILTSQQEVFCEAEKAIADMGGSIPGEYVRKNVSGLEGAMDRRVSALLSELHKLRAHVGAGA